MGTLTSRLKLLKPALTDLVDVVTQLNDNYDRLDEVAGVIICTSATRPSGGDLFTGAKIYETDTTKEYVYNGSQWVLTGGAVANRIGGGTSNVGTAGAGFSINAVYADTFYGGKLVVLNLYLDLTVALVVAGALPNITDKVAFTLAPGLRPVQNTTLQWGNGACDGETDCFTDGTISIRSGNALPAVASNIRIAGTIVTP